MKWLQSLLIGVVLATMLLVVGVGGSVLGMELAVLVSGTKKEIHLVGNIATVFLGLVVICTVVIRLFFYHRATHLK